MSETMNREKISEDHNQVDLVAAQLELEKLFSKNQLIPRIKAVFQECAEVNFAEYMTLNGIPVEFGMALLVQMVLHKRASLPTMVGIMYHHLNDAQATADMLLKAAEADLVDWSPNLHMFVVKFDISDELQEELDKFQYPLPMVTIPKPIRTNRHSGYMLNQSSVILRNNHHESDVCLDHLNRLNRIRLTINTTTVQMIQNKWKNLDKAKEGESKQDFERRRKAFAKYDRTSRDIIKGLMTITDTFYMTHKYDKRGRTYCQGYHINYQGTPWNKAVVEFHDTEIVTG